jgi:hypothetical protein
LNNFSYVPLKGGFWLDWKLVLVVALPMAGVVLCLWILRKR